MQIDFYQLDTHALADGLTAYHKTMVQQLRVAKDEEFDRIGSAAKGMSEVNEADYQIRCDEHVWMHDFMFPRLFRYSFIVLVFLVIEAQLNSLCSVLKSRREL